MLTAVTVAWSGITTSTTLGADKPNIVFIMTDDHGNADLRYRGGEISFEGKIDKVEVGLKS